MKSTKLFQAVVGFGLVMGACSAEVVSANDASNASAEDAGAADASATDAPADTQDAATDAKLDGPHKMDAADGWHTTK